MITFNKECSFVELDTKKHSVRIGKKGFFIGKKVNTDPFKSITLSKEDD